MIYKNCLKCKKEFRVFPYRKDTAKRYEWANKTNKYLRNLEDWLSLCHVCHVEYDKSMGFYGNRTKI